jgi:pSer/pThr/pTyr-binding forkhead associated (FHA) protein
VTEHNVRPGRTTIGRSFRSDIPIDDPTVAARHAIVLHDEHGTRIVRGRSPEGIVVNGRPIWSSELVDGDEVWLGRVHLVFVAV